MKNQLMMDIYSGKLGGRRPGAGRKSKHSKGVRHRKREKVTARTPLHINFKFKLFIRTYKFKEILEGAIENAGMKGLFVRIYAIESNHVHLIVETSNNSCLSSGMRSLLKTITKRLAKGSVQIERYHLHVLKTPTEVKNAVHYVKHNHVKHTGRRDEEFMEIVSRGESWSLNQAL